MSIARDSTCRHGAVRESLLQAGLVFLSLGLASLAWTGLFSLLVLAR
jgi:hypothetical protein